MGNPFREEKRDFSLKPLEEEEEEEAKEESRYAVRCGDGNGVTAGERRRTDGVREPGAVAYFRGGGLEEAEEEEEKKALYSPEDELGRASDRLEVGRAT